MRAYLDESVRAAAPGLYVVAAAVVRPASAEEARRRLRDVAGKAQRLHWRAESGQRRHTAVATIADLAGVEHLVAVCTPMNPKRQERSRRHALTRLLWELEQRAVNDVVFETRQHRDAEDRAHIASQQRAGHLSRRLRYGYGQPKQEPLLWLPDVVAGAVAYARAGLDPSYLEALGPAVVVVDINPAA